VSILLDGSTRLLVQGMTGGQGSFHTQLMREVGTVVVAGVTPGRAGHIVKGLEDVPVFHTVQEAVEETDATASCIFVPAPFAADAILEDVAAGIRVIVCLTEGIPVLDMLRVMPRVTAAGAHLIGPNCPGVTTPGDQVKVGVMPWDVHSPGPVGVVSRSGTLTYEVVQHLTNLGIGQSTTVGIGGDPIIGTRFNDVLKMFEADQSTTGVVLLGEIGGDDEERAATYIRECMSKPVSAFIAGKTAPPERRMGHAGAIVSGSAGTAVAKETALRDAGVLIGSTPEEAAHLLAGRID
jgi:succinyl-CoA synthetase alpha subunit